MGAILRIVALLTVAMMGATLSILSIVASPFLDNAMSAKRGTFCRHGVEFWSILGVVPSRRVKGTSYP